MVNLQQALTFILQYRRGKAFENWSPMAIRTHLMKSFHNHTILIVSEGKEVQAVITGEFESDDSVHIIAAIVKPGVKHALSKALKLWQDTFGYKLSAQRHGEYVELSESYLNKVSKLA